MSCAYLGLCRKADDVRAGCLGGGNRALIDDPLRNLLDRLSKECGVVGIVRRVHISSYMIKQNAPDVAELRHLVETYEAAEAHGNHNFQTLLDFSLGRISDLRAMGALGIESEEDLFLLMARAHLPMPRLDASTTREITESLHSLAK